MMAVSLWMGNAAAAPQGWFSGISAPSYIQLTDPTVNVGSASMLTSKVVPGLGINNSSAAPRALALGGMGTVPLSSRFGLIGKLASTRTEGDPTLSSWNYNLADAFSYNLLGLGLKYDLTRSLRFQGGWDRYQLRYNRVNGDAGVDLLSIGLRYGF